MIITDDFVMLNFPKTGSSFARKVIKELYPERSGWSNLLVKWGLRRPSFVELMFPQIDLKENHGLTGQHGTLRQIPSAHQHKQMVTITRNPFSRYVSLYLFGWWKSYPPGNREEIATKYPHFPNLSFPEFYEMGHEFGRRNRLRDITPRIELGLQTIQFIQFYFRDPDSVLSRIDDEYISQRQYQRDMGNVHFVHQENLNSELKKFLLQIGIPGRDLVFVDSMEKVNVTEKKPEKADYQSFYEGTSIERDILHREKLLFAIFPEYLPRTKTCDVDQ